ncbi:DUF421 domain-containing protein [Neobacillus sp. LXY-4]|uniref:DUF421 domain-containing protein n=1 Tax=Neobacillus sp. LXY-4 TaxID=3379826 RepID=UPI003EE256AF
MEEYLIIIIRTLVLYLLILMLFRLMGKREIGELSLLDLVVFMMIAEMAAVSIENTDDSIWRTILPMALLMMIQILFAFISIKSKKFRDLIDGKPTVIISDGKIDEESMRKQRYNFDDLLLQLREKNIRNIADVEFAILESSGKLSVFEKQNNPGKTENGGFTIPLIMDGTIQEQNLMMINKTNLWLRQQLKKKGYNHIKDISFCSYQDGEFFIDIKDEK